MLNHPSDAEIHEWPLRCPAPYFVVGEWGAKLQEAARTRNKTNWRNANQFRTLKAAQSALDRIKSKHRTP